MAGRFAPSPTGDLHLGNLRTALVAWLATRAEGLDFLVRMEDLDQVTSSRDHEQRQLADLAWLGIDHDGDVIRQSDRFHLYQDAIARLDQMGLVYRCFCTRREIATEIAAAASAPHPPVDAIEPGATLVPDGAYPGTCRDMASAEQAERRASGRAPALRLRAGAAMVEVVDEATGSFRGVVDDVVLQRNDGVPAYNLAVVVDDALQGVTRVVRGADLLSSTPRQVHLQHLLGLPTPAYLHVPLVLGESGARLAKRDGAVTRAALVAAGVSACDVLRWLARSLALEGWAEAGSARDLLAALDGAALDPGKIPRKPVTFTSTITHQR